MSNWSANVRANFNPTRSSVFALGSLLLSVIVLLAGAYLISKQSYNAGLLLVVPALLGCTSSYLLGYSSRRDQDLDSAHPLSVVGADDGSYSISADPRTDKELLLETIAAVACVMKDRKPLPEPDGLVGERGIGDGSKKDQAIQLAHRINEQIEKEQVALQSAIDHQQKRSSANLENAPNLPPILKD